MTGCGRVGGHEYDRANKRILSAPEAEGAATFIPPPSFLISHHSFLPWIYYPLPPSAGPLNGLSSFISCQGSTQSLWRWQPSFRKEVWLFHISIWAWGEKLINELGKAVLCWNGIAQDRNTNRLDRSSELWVHRGLTFEVKDPGENKSGERSEVKRCWEWNPNLLSN